MLGRFHTKPHHQPCTYTLGYNSQRISALRRVVPVIHTGLNVAAIAQRVWML